MMKRLFIGIPMVSEVAANQAAIWKNDRPLNTNRINWSRYENWHITLFFLGNTSVDRIAVLRKLIDESFRTVSGFCAGLKGVGVFPDQRDPKVLWLGLEGLESLMPAYEQLGQLLRDHGFEYDRKPLKPHLTIARVKHLEHRSSLESVLSEFQDFDFGSVAVDRLVLYESVSTSHGPVYQPVFEKQLG